MDAVRVEDIAGVADGAFTDLAAVDNRIHGDTHVFNPVEAVKHAEHVNAGFCRLADKFLHHIVRVVGVANAV